MALLQAPVVVADGSAAQLLVADVVASRDRVEATFSLDAELRQGFLLAGAAADRVEVEVALVTGSWKQIFLLRSGGLEISRRRSWVQFLQRRFSQNHMPI